VNLEDNGYHQYVTQGEKKIKSIKRIWNSTKYSNVCVIEVTEGEQREN
jgi:hypothetical protein